MLNNPRKRTSRLSRLGSKSDFRKKEKTQIQTPPSHPSNKSSPSRPPPRGSNVYQHRKGTINPRFISSEISELTGMVFFTPNRLPWPTVGHGTSSIWAMTSDPSVVLRHQSPQHSWGSISQPMIQVVSLRVLSPLGLSRLVRGLTLEGF